MIAQIYVPRFLQSRQKLLPLFLSSYLLKHLTDVHSEHLNHLKA
ncbi:hypothetical protein DsansV1_C18g0154461 [Dioscorea sansibarensis]